MNRSKCNFYVTILMYLVAFRTILIMQEYLDKFHPGHNGCNCILTNDIKYMLYILFYVWGYTEWQQKLLKKNTGRMVELSSFSAHYYSAISHLTIITNILLAIFLFSFFFPFLFFFLGCYLQLCRNASYHVLFHK